MQNLGGYKQEPHKFKDYSFEKIFGSAPFLGPTTPLNRDISGIPVVYQGSQNTCVSCTIVWIKQYLEKEKPHLSWEWLANISNTRPDGATPSQVLEPARKIGICLDQAWKEGEAAFNDQALSASQHRIGSYAYVKLDKQSIYQALKESPLAIGLDNFQGFGPHMLAAYDMSPSGQTLKCVTWGDANVQQLVEIPFDENIVECIAFPSVTDADGTFALSKIDVLLDKVSFLSSRPVLRRTISAILGIVSAVVLSLLAVPSVTPAPKFGASGVVGAYRTTLSSSISNSATSLAVSSATLKTGEVFTSANLQFPIYLTTNPGGSTEETMECGAYSALTFSSCNRGMSYLGGNTTSTVSGAAYAHAAGETVIMANIPAFYNRFLDTFSTQNVGGTKTFTSSTLSLGDSGTSTEKIFYFKTGSSSSTYIGCYGPSGSNTTSTCVLNLGAGELSLTASGTSVGIESNGGLHLTGGLLGISVSTTQGVATDTGNNLILNVSSTASTNGGFLNFVTSTNALGKVFWDIKSFLSGAWTWLGNQIFSGSVTFNGTTIFNATTTITSITTVSSTTDIVNFGSLLGEYATGTSGVAITAGQAVRQGGDGTIFLAASNATNTVYEFIGIAANTVTGASQQVLYVRPGGIATIGVSGLTADQPVFEQNSSGGIGNTPGTIVARIGRALSATSMLVLSPTFTNRQKGSSSITFDGSTTTVATTWIPTKIQFTCSGTGAFSTGIWMSNNTGGSPQQSAIGWNAATPASLVSNQFSCAWTEAGPNPFNMYVVTSTTGFSIGTNTVGGSPARTINYYAERNDDYDVH